MNFLYNLLILYFSLEVGKVEAAKKDMGPIGNVILSFIAECPDGERPKDDDIKISWDLRDTGVKTFSATLENKIPIDSSINYTAIIKKRENGSWKKVYDVSGTPCTDIKKYVPKVLAKLKPLIKPDPGKDCPINPGKYSVKDITMQSKEIGIPSIFYGELLVQVTAIDKNGKRIFCFIAEAQSQG